ncbi:MAG: PQQ-dependent sugar dehydrogenase [Verrucomicrobiota bacterium]
MRPSRLLLAAALFAPLVPAHAQHARPTGKINDLYAQLCANCHGKNLEGAQAPSMLDDVWTAGGDDESLAKSIRNGFPEKGMPAWGAAIPEKEVRAMVIFIRERRANHEREKATAAPKIQGPITAKTELHSFTLDTWVDKLAEPYGLAFLGKDRAIVTEKKGAAYLIETGKRAETPIAGMPKVDTAQQAGLYDVVPHPKFAQNGWLYFAFADPKERPDPKDATKTEKVSLTKIIRGKIKDNALIQQETIYEADVAHYIKAGGVHFGGRIAFDKQDNIYFVVGERGTKMLVQDLTLPVGKVHRLRDDGQLPPDNPYAKDPKAIKSVWSSGHRNPQGLAIDPRNGDIYDAEHGPRGGDELNLVGKGKNYGWPVISYGMEYDGSALTDLTHKEGMEQPVVYWLPSIAPCGINFYTGDSFPKWKNNLFLASLAAMELRRIEIKDQKVVKQEVIFKNAGRIRHVIGGPDGAIYVLLPERIARLTPAQ